MKKLFLILLAFATTSVHGQDMDSFIELLRSDVKTGRKAIITEAMEFTGDEASAFWQVYRDYEFELDKQNDARLALLKDYAANFDAMTDAKAKELIEKSLHQQEDRVKLRKDYFKKFSKVLPATKAARFMQVDNQIQLLLDLKIASNLPLVEKVQ